MCIRFGSCDCITALATAAVGAPFTFHNESWELTEPPLAELLLELPLMIDSVGTAAKIVFDHLVSIFESVNALVLDTMVMVGWRLGGVNDAGPTYILAIGAWFVATATTVQADADDEEENQDNSSDQNDITRRQLVGANHSPQRGRTVLDDLGTL